MAQRVGGARDLTPRHARLLVAASAVVWSRMGGGRQCLPARHFNQFDQSSAGVYIMYSGKVYFKYLYLLRGIERQRNECSIHDYLKREVPTKIT